jgi:hypothetical protein
MVRPAAFQYNVQTAASNDFQRNIEGVDYKEVLQKAREEFDAMVGELRDHEIEVLVFEDTQNPIKPDAIFPNNWISLSQDGILTIYPMKTENRRLEKRSDIIDYFRKNYKVTKEIDLSEYEHAGRALEGTGSIVFDHASRVAFACLSPRTDASLFVQYCTEIQYKPLVFHSYDSNDKLIYHTNVVMCIGSGYVVIGLESIKNIEERNMLEQEFKNLNLEIIALDSNQLLHSFAGNMLEVQNQKGTKYLVMSQRAHRSLTTNQLEQLQRYVQVLPVSIDIIETIGGGSARCMMAEVYLEKK